MCVFLLTQRREERLQNQLSNPHYLKPSAAASSSSSTKITEGRSGESVGLTEATGLTTIDTSKIPVQKLELGVGLIIGESCDLLLHACHMYMYVLCISYACTCDKVDGTI